MSMKMNKLGIIHGNFRMFGLSIMHCKGHNQSFFIVGDLKDILALLQTLIENSNL